MDQKSEIRIDIKNDEKSIIKFGFGLTAFFFFTAVLLFIYLAFLYLSEEPLTAMIYFAISVFLYIVGRNYLSNTFYKEYLLIYDKKIKVVYKSFGKIKQHEFDLDKVNYIKYVGHENFTEHPMDSPTIDFTGLGVSEKEVQKIISEGTLEISTNETKFRFGKDIPSWEAERVIEEFNRYQ